LCYDRDVENEQKCIFYGWKGNTMEKYTDLEQAIQDPSLVIITDQITTQTELNQVFVKYKTLPRKQRRFSNYYSNEFLGHDVPEMYVLVRDKLIAEANIFEDLQLPNEKYVHTEPDLYYKEESFNSGNTNICFILGHSGSGKSRMARTLEGDEIDHIELDDLLLARDHFTMDELKGYSDMFYSFFAGEGAKYYIGLEERNSIPKEEYEDKVFVDFVKFAMEYSKQHREKKYIVEGIWIYLYFEDPSVFDDYAVFIKGTSFLKSKIRAMKREMQRDKETLQERKQMFGRETRNYFLDEDKIDIYRNYFGDKPDTIFREETDEAAKKREEVINELKSIDKYFVNNDIDAINEIMKKAEADTELSKWNKLRIITECKSALFDLHVKVPL
jgi:energy-coupling factor transporter ATP-binding protein EcfA2